MTDKASATPKQDQRFGWNEKPFVFLRFENLDAGHEDGHAGHGGRESRDDNDHRNTLFVKWAWRHNDSPSPVFSENGRFSDFEDDVINIWRSMDSWDTKKKTGGWGVKTNWHFEGEGEGANGGVSHFTVTPEPLSSIIFLIGGALLTARRFKNNRRNKKEVIT